MSPEERLKYLPQEALDEIARQERQLRDELTNGVKNVRKNFCSDENVDDLIAKYGNQLGCSIEEFKKMSPEERLKYLPKEALDELARQEQEA